MNALAALAALRNMGIPVVYTNDAAAFWGVKPPIASKILSRLAKAGHLVSLHRGMWLVDSAASSWAVHSYLTDPSPSYISLQTALFHHGMIEQIPTIIHLISTGKTRRLRTPIGDYAIHQVQPRFFTGFSPLDGGPAQIATPEKALIDFFYLRPSKTRAFRSLPELTIPKTFKPREARRLANLIISRSRRAMVLAALEACLNP
jgi:predicted transcriptional regulator of viral defense system